MEEIKEIREKIKDYIIKLNSKELSVQKLRDDPRYKKLITQIQDINRINNYQWEYISGDEVWNLLETHYIFHFIIQNLRTLNRLQGDENEFAPRFKKEFKQLEREILLGNYFNYKIIAPAYRLHLPKGKSNLVLDKDHRIVLTSKMKSNYKIKNIDEIPKSWSRNFKDKSQFSFLIGYRLKKRLKNEDPYQDYENPIRPEDSRIEYNIFIEKLRSICDFFVVYSDIYSNETLNFGDRFYVIPPKFSLDYQFSLEFTYSDFPPPRNPIHLAQQEKIFKPKDWKKTWKNHYSDFYSDFYTDDGTFPPVKSFRYILKVLRITENIPYEDVSAFLLISSFEGVLFFKDVKNKLKKERGSFYSNHEKRGPVIDIFLLLCEKYNKNWQDIFQVDFPLKKKLTTFQTKLNLKNFLHSCFDYRNNIAHADYLGSLTVKPASLRIYPDNDEFVLRILINKHFPLILKFILKSWINEKCKSEGKWKEYLLSLV